MLKSTHLMVVVITLGLMVCRPPAPDGAAATQTTLDIEYLTTPEM